MDFTTVLIAYAINVISSVSMKYMEKRMFSGISMEVLMVKTMKSSVKSYNYKNHKEQSDIEWCVNAIINSFSVFKESIENVRYNHFSTSEMSLPEFVDKIVTEVIDSYSFETRDRKSLFRFFQYVFREFNDNFFDHILTKKEDKLILNLITKKGKENLSFENINQILNIAKKTQVSTKEELRTLFYDEIKRLESSDITGEIQFEFSRVGRIIQKLTEDQFKAINYQKYHDRMIIQGCAGSGKTIVAIEKAIRLSQSGKKTLILCFNPFLARHVRRITSKFNVEVRSFSELINYINGENAGFKNSKKWHHDIAPRPNDISLAFDTVVTNRIYYDAIIVDEGQDFDEEWWILIDALFPPESKTLLIFADDNQRIGTNNLKYPITLAPFSFSKNIRNSGEIHKVVSYFHSNPPPISPELNSEGHTNIIVSKNQLCDTAKYLATSFPGWGVILASREISEEIKSFQEKTEFQLKEALIESLNVYLGAGIINQIPPTEQEIEFVKVYTSRLQPESQLTNKEKQSIKYFWEYSKSYILKWENLKKIEYRRTTYMKAPWKIVVAWSYKFDACIKHYFTNRKWFELLPEIHPLPGGFEIHNVESFKGLESPNVVLFVDDLNFTELYIGASRATQNLTIVIHPDNLARLEQFNNLDRVIF